MTQYIREGRFGPPKAYKTGAVVSSYPRPILVLNFDEGGLDVIKEPITWLKPNELVQGLDKTYPENAIIAVDFCDISQRLVTEVYSVTANKDSFSQVSNVVNALVKSKTMPFRTIVVDPVTGLSEIVLGHIAATQAAQLADPRKWASSIGIKVQQTIAVLNQVQAHTVYIMHSVMEKNELSGTIVEIPMIHSRFRDRVGALLSQFFYACKEGGKPVVVTTDRGYVKGIGARWPDNLPAVCGPLYKDIYERK